MCILSCVCLGLFSKCRGTNTRCSDFVNFVFSMDVYWNVWWLPVYFATVDLTD